MILRVPIIMDIFTLMKYSVEEMLLPGKDAVTEIQEEKNMAETVRVVVDAMGGDNAPAEPVKAAVEAVTERDDIVVILTGKQEVIESELSKFQNYPKERIQVVNATEVIETAEPPVVAIRKKKDSSHCGRPEPCEEAGSRCFCFLRKLRSDSGRRPGDS